MSAGPVVEAGERGAAGARITERRLTEIWKRQLVNPDRMVTGWGTRVRIVHTGRENRDRGADFIGAVVEIGEGEVIRGDIELHLHAADWRRHGHHRDPAYNSVVLQVAWHGDSDIVLESGRVVPTLSVRDCLGGPLDEVLRRAELPMRPHEPCREAGRWLGGETLRRVLRRAGETRFHRKAEGFASALKVEWASQVLYQSMMGALGYTKNKEPFEELSRRVRLSVLEDVCKGMGPESRVRIVKALLLGTAGLLPQAGHDQSGEAELRPGRGEAMAPSSWRLFRVRPDNHPVRRLAGAAHLISRFADRGGLLEGVLCLVETPDSTVSEIEKAFVVRAVDSPAHGVRPLVGRCRAREIAINVVLPFTFAWAEANARPDLASRSLALYRGCPKAGDNGMTKGLAARLSDLANRPAIDSAQCEQGLIHVVKDFCWQLRCVDCPIAVELTRSSLSA